jgi:release factor glutamine methyltransferase
MPPPYSGGWRSVNLRNARNPGLGAIGAAAQSAKDSAFHPVGNRHECPAKMKAVLETLQDGAAYLEKRGVENARLNMEHLLAHVLGCKRMQVYLWFDRPLEEKELGALRELTISRGKRVPLQHLLGTVEFHGRTFKCDGRALIPRPETEELVEKILASVKDRPVPQRFLDMGTGSGIIGITLALAWPQAQGALADISGAALELAAENAAALEAGAKRLHFVRSDLFAGLEDERFDVIAANLPYIASGELGQLSPEVRSDPAAALDGGPLGTEIIERFIAQLPAHLEPGGLAALEIGAGQSETLAAALRAAGLDPVWKAPDLSGIDRFLFARRTEAPAQD